MIDWNKVEKDYNYTKILQKENKDLQQQLDKYKLILKALHKHFFEHEEYENNEFLRQLESCTENDMIWLKRTAGDDEE